MAPQRPATHGQAKQRAACYSSAVEITMEDRDLLERAARTEGVEHVRLAAVARITLAVLARLDALQERLEKLEAGGELADEPSQPKKRKTG